MMTDWSKAANGASTLPAVTVCVPEAASVLCVVCYGESALKSRSLKLFLGFRDIPENLGWLARMSMADSLLLNGHVHLSLVSDPHHL